MTFLLQRAVDQEWWLLQKHWRINWQWKGEGKGTGIHTRGGTGAFHTLPLRRGKDDAEAAASQQQDKSSTAQLELREGCSATSSQKQPWDVNPPPPVLTGPGLSPGTGHR